jgi:hypothetical protein
MLSSANVVALFLNLAEFVSAIPPGFNTRTIPAWLWYHLVCVPKRGYTKSHRIDCLQRQITNICFTSASGENKSVVV